jgi:allantoinase
MPMSQDAARPAAVADGQVELHRRVPYSALPDRPALSLPGDARVAIWTVVNVENWSIERAMPRTVLPPPMHDALMPDIPNWSWHEYGMRVGFWRLAEMLANVGVVPTLAVNGSVCTAYPRVAEAALQAGWEFVGHGYVQQPMHRAPDQAEAIARTIEAIRTFTGRPPRGWESPGLTETFETVDLLAEAGLEYVADWVLDDEPCEIQTRAGPLVAMPYTVELNDVALMAVQHQPPEELARRALLQFERLYAEGERSARVMAISLHPYLSGAAHRIAHMEQLYTELSARPGVVFWTGEQILDWWRGARSASVKA